MKTLTIVRHGKSSWDYTDVNDIDRPLKVRGINDAYTMAQRLDSAGHKCDLIISSPASRAIHTALIFSRVLNISDEKMKINSGLFHAGEDEIMDIIYGVDDQVSALMIYGHNPGFTLLANYLSTLSIPNVPTAGLVILEFECQKWNEIDKTNCKTQFFDYPKNN